MDFWLKNVNYQKFQLLVAAALAMSARSRMPRRLRARRRLRLRLVRMRRGIPAMVMPEFRSPNNCFIVM